MWRLCKSGRFSYGESPRTPPLEGNSLHRRNNSVERPWGILSLFTTCSQLFISEFSLPKAVTQTCGVFANQVVFLTVNHRGPLPLREIHSTDETIVWRDPGGSWACLRPVQLFIPAKGCDTDMWRLCKPGRFSYGESPRTPPHEGNSLHRRNNSVERP